MARKEINIFGTSFLDLLSGALAAVIILFIIVPKMTQENIDAIEKVKKIESVVENIDVALEEIKNRIPKEEYDLIINDGCEIRISIEKLKKENQSKDEKIKADNIATLKGIMQELNLDFDRAFEIARYDVSLKEEYRRLVEEE